MKLTRSSLPFVALAGLFTSFALISTACSPNNGGGDGDGDTGSGGNANLEYTFCGPASTCPPDVSGVDLTTPVSFKTDIYPIFTSSCSGGSGCHGSELTTGLGFGTATAPLDDAGLQALVTQLTTAPSGLAAAEKNVVAGDWTKSFMMMKLDGCQNQNGVSCNVPNDLLSYVLCADSEVNPANCGDAMPQSEGTANNPTPYPLTDVNRNKIRAWIQQGALLN